MARNSGPSARNLLSSHGVGAGKGDKTRTNLASPQWLNNYSEVDWSGSVTGFNRVGNKLVKIYR